MKAAIPKKCLLRMKTSVKKVKKRAKYAENQSLVHSVQQNVLKLDSLNKDMIFLHKSKKTNIKALTSMCEKLYT